MAKKFIAAALMITALLLAGCGETVASTQVLDYGDFEDYYSSLQYEVRNDDGVVTEQMYFLCTDPELTGIAGKKSVYFNGETGEMNRYTVTIGILAVERVYSYTKDDLGLTYYTEMFYDSGQVLKRGTWDNNYFDTEGKTYRDTGEEVYYTDGKTVKTFHLEHYEDGKLVETTDRTFDPHGEMTSETVK